MSRRSLLPDETHARRSHGGRKRAKKSEKGLQVAAAVDDEAEGRGPSPHLPRGQTRVGTRGIRFLDQDTHAPQPGELRRARDVLSDGESLVAKDTEIADFHPGATPGDGFRRHRGSVPAAPVREGRERGLRLPQRRAALVTRARRARARPGEDHNAENRGAKPGYGRGEAESRKDELHRRPT